MSVPRKIGIFGGTFNPVHLGHLLVAETALEQFELHQIIWVPTYQPPHKQQDLLDFGHRWEMVQRAIADHPDFFASDLEQQHGGISYAISTLTTLQATYPNTDWYWIIGSDAFQGLPQWRSSIQIATQCIWLVAPRDVPQSQIIGQEVVAALTVQSRPHPLRFEWHLLQMPQVDISSSTIRQACQQGRSLRYQVPESVREYIMAHQLYQQKIRSFSPSASAQGFE